MQHRFEELRRVYGQDVARRIFRFEHDQVGTYMTHQTILLLFFTDSDRGRPRSPVSGPVDWFDVLTLRLIPRGEARIASLIAHARRLDEMRAGALRAAAAQPPMGINQETGAMNFDEARLRYLNNAYAFSMSRRIYQFEFEVVGAHLSDHLINRMFFRNVATGVPRSRGGGPEGWAIIINLSAVP